MIERIDKALCIGCGTCVDLCPLDTLRLGEDGKARIAYPDECMTCFLCERNCPAGAVSVDPFSEPLAPAFGPDRRVEENRPTHPGYDAFAKAVV